MTAEQRIAELDSRGVELRDICRTVNPEFKSRLNAPAIRAVLRQVKSVGFSDATEDEVSL
jgi:hypothetical protein